MYLPSSSEDDYYYHRRRRFGSRWHFARECLVYRRTFGHLVRRRGETLAQLLGRLDQAIDKALSEDIYTNEINPPSSHS